jgi:serine protease AprX
LPHRCLACICLSLVLTLWWTPRALCADWRSKVDAGVLLKSATAETEFLVWLGEQADLSDATRFTDREARISHVHARLNAVAQRTQRPLIEALERAGAEYRSYWVANMIWVRGGSALLESLARSDGVAGVYANTPYTVPLPEDEARVAKTSAGIEWNVLKIDAPDVWALGYHGEGVVVADADTGVDWDHPALKEQYRGWHGSFADHAYSWHDAIHSSTGPCGADSLEPCDDLDHGTHTTGTMVGDDGGDNQIGVAPGARWIACRNMNGGEGTPASYSECFQWFIAPTDLAGQNPDPSMAPHVINNSWYCPPEEGCTNPGILRAVIENTRAAGIAVVVSASNEGPACGSVNTPPAIYEASLAVAATDIVDQLFWRSARGPVTVDGSMRLKPDISAPGVSVRSSVRNGLYALKSGTSMAAPHVAGLMALMISANPWLGRDVDTLTQLIESSALPMTTTEGCGGDSPTDVPNHSFGHGLIDAPAAVQAGLEWMPVPALPAWALFATGFWALGIAIFRRRRA